MFVLVVFILKMTIVYVCSHVGVSVCAYSPHNLYHTGHIKNDKQCVIGS